MAFVLDELIRETCTFLSPTTLQLNGAAANHRRFRDARRPDGSPIASGDETVVGVFQTAVGRAICKATFNSGAQDTLTLSTAAPEIFQSTAGASLPGFSSAGQPGDVYMTTAVPLFAVFDIAGNLLKPELFRSAILPTELAPLLAQASVVDGETVFAASPANGGGLTLAQRRALRAGGLFMQDNAASGANDSVDTFTLPGASAGRAKRVGLKVAPTERGVSLAAAGVVDIVTAAAGQVYVVDAYDEAAPANHLSGRIIGRSGDADIVDIVQRGTLEFAQSGATVRLRNGGGGAGTFAYTLERIA